MPDETTTPVAAAEAKPAVSTPATPPAEAQKTETPAEVMIPKARFDEVNNALKKLQGDAAEQAKAQAAAEAKALAEQGKYKELFEKQQADLAAAEAKARESELKLLRREAAAQTSLPAALAERLQGETLEEMVADAKAMLDAVEPLKDKTPVPGNGGRPKVAGPSGSKPASITPITDVRRNF